MGPDQTALIWVHTVCHKDFKTLQKTEDDKGIQLLLYLVKVRRRVLMGPAEMVRNTIYCTLLR